MIDSNEDIEFRNEFAQAFIHWQFVESELFKIFAYLLAAPQGGAVSVVFHSVINFNAKLAMTDAAAQFLLPRKMELLSEWNTLRNHIGRQVKRRNQLAHFNIVYLTNADKSQIPFLEPQPNPGINTSSRIGTKRLADWRLSFLVLADKMYRFSAMLYESEIAQPKRELPPSPYIS